MDLFDEVSLGNALVFSEVAYQLYKCFSFIFKINRKIFIIFLLFKMKNVKKDKKRSSSMKHSRGPHREQGLNVCIKNSNDGVHASRFSPGFNITTRLFSDHGSAGRPRNPYGSPIFEHS